MKHTQLFSRRPGARVDFRPDPKPGSPFTQLRRLSEHLQSTNAPAEDLTDCPDALYFLREYTYRKIFTQTTHEDFVALDRSHPAAIDWLIAVHEVETANFRSTRK